MKPNHFTLAFVTWLEEYLNRVVDRNYFEEGHHGSPVSEMKVIIKFGFQCITVSTFGLWSAMLLDASSECLILLISSWDWLSSAGEAFIVLLQLPEELVMNCLLELFQFMSWKHVALLDSESQNFDKGNRTTYTQPT